MNYVRAVSKRTRTSFFKRESSYAHGGFAVTDRRAALPQSYSGPEVDNIIHVSPSDIYNPSSGISVSDPVPTRPYPATVRQGYSDIQDSLIGNEENKERG